MRVYLHDYPELAKIGTPECMRWANGIFNRHARIADYLIRFYIRKAREAGHVSANAALNIADKDLEYFGMGAAAKDDLQLSDLADARSRACKKICSTEGARLDIFELAARFQQYCGLFGVDFPFEVKKTDSEMVAVNKASAAINKVRDARWWLRNLRKNMARRVEQVLRSMGFVRKGKAPYLSEYLYKGWLYRQSKNRDMINASEVVADIDGVQVSVDLAECVDASVANPENRRNELMVRIRGYEEIADTLGYRGLLFTLTCPSRFHAQSIGGGANKRYCGACPREAMAYLNEVWARLRASWLRAGVKTFGFRVTEPHHDGTPHCHFFLFFNPDDVNRCKEIFGHYALQDSPEEDGASKHRWDVVDIDPCKGTASGYIAKYISKNIDGFEVLDDIEGQCSGSDGAVRARAWASLWGIRQFQQIGSVSVTVWRELRRRNFFVDEDAPTDEMRALHAAADEGDWRKFVELMGGPCIRRDEQLARPQYVESEAVRNEYDEPVKKLIGLWFKPLAARIGRFISTRQIVWSMRRKAGVGVQVAAQPPPLDL